VVADSVADIGIGFDGDGDRIGVVDAKGRQVPGDFLTAYLAQDILSRQPAAAGYFGCQIIRYGGQSDHKIRG
jgi:phosphomannomutase